MEEYASREEGMVRMKKSKNKDIVEQGMVRKEKRSKKRKNKHLEEGRIRKEKSNNRENKAIELLYTDTPSDDGYDEPSPKSMMKPPPFSKVWSDEDEISILRGMIEFKDQTGRDAGQSVAEFREFIFQSLALQPTLIQLREKIRRLREKYEKSVGRGSAFATPHQLQLFQLGQQIWTQHPISATGQGKQSNPDKQHDIPESGRPRQQNVEQHRIIPETGLDAQALHELIERVAKDKELVVNSEACLRGSKKEVEMRVLDISLQSMSLGIKLGTLVYEKAISPELRNSPVILEQEALKAYLEAKREHAQLLLNAYNSYIEDHSNEAQSSPSASKD